MSCTQGHQTANSAIAGSGVPAEMAVQQGGPGGNARDAASGRAAAEGILAEAYQELGAEYWKKDEVFDPDAMDAGCRHLSRAAQAMGLPGDLCVVWEVFDKFGFGGDSNLYYVAPNGRGCVIIAVPFQGDAQPAEFLDELAAIAEGRGPAKWKKLGRRYREEYNIARHHNSKRELL
jgi:hypothetical protein